MKKTLLALTLLIFSLNVNADERSKAILDKITSTIKSYQSYQVDFKATMPGEFTNITGNFIVSGNRYFLDVYNSQILYDGKLRYTYNKSENEVIIENNDPKDKNILANPTQIFALYDRDFTHTYRGNSTIELKPKIANGVFDLVILKVDNQGMPQSISYNLIGVTNKVSMSIIKITPNVKVTPSTFSFDKSKHKGVEIIDFR